MLAELESKQAFILHTRAFKENQLIIEFLVEGEGRVSIIASKGGKKNTARTALLQPFRPLIIKYKQGRGLHSLKSIDINSTSSDIRLKSKSLFCGFYLNEVLCRLCKSDAQYDELFPLYNYALSHLQHSSERGVDSQSGMYLEAILRQFEYRLLVMLGYGISFDYDLHSEADIKADKYYELLAGSGFVYSNNPQRAIIGSELIGIDKFLNTDLEIDKLSAQQLKLAKLILRACLHRHLGDKPLKSRELFRK
ncbi:DNA repair protein RecO [Psychrosphaera sp. F3M07]|uniref:DNA repair protein RecO n=1 Tax=Psychrosphaera aquimarina TaxID=2044854 RepID=A0ABU3R366_9GAMM|nr:MULTISPECIES: DNA repair protein RecO [Psychrosphaera]MBU2919239.1 DNA repair protein RecO [Psychrosphaera sp. F3M07]MDU0113922.1 DNA repair protein RecO [Psychrosphaera aquimarina]